MLDIAPMDIEIISGLEYPLACQAGQMNPQVATLDVLVHVGCLVAGIATV